MAHVSYLTRSTGAVYSEVLYRNSSTRKQAAWTGVLNYQVSRAISFAYCLGQLSLSQEARGLTLTIPYQILSANIMQIVCSYSLM